MIRQLLKYAEQALPEEQCAALALWLKGATDDEIDAELGLAAGRGRKLMRAAVATLRRRFVGAD
jgi:hypothetical protein